MNLPELKVIDLLAVLLAKANANSLTPMRLKDWHKVIAWQIEGLPYYWVSDGAQFNPSVPVEADLVLKCSEATLQRVVDGSLPFFIGIWGTNEIAFEGSYADAYRLGYIFLSDKTHLNI